MRRLFPSMLLCLVYSVQSALRLPLMRHHTKELRTWATTRMNLTSYLDVGSPGQWLSVFVDTGSAWLWVPSSTCDTCVDFDSFDSEDSHSYESLDVEKHLPYEQGECTGVISQDSVTLGDESSAVTQTFVLVNTQTGIQNPLRVDGVLGLAFNTLSDGYPTFVESLVSTGHIEYPTFTLHLSDDYSRSYLEFGAQSLDKSSHAVPLWNPGKYWSVLMPAVRVNHVDFTGTRIAVFDSSRSCLDLPQEDFQSIISVISADYSNCGYDMQILVCPCSVTAQMYDIRFTLGDEVFTVSQKDYVLSLGQTDEGVEVCAVLIRSVNVTIEGMQAWVLGDVFFKVHDILFDMRNNLVVIEKDPGSGGLSFWVICLLALALCSCLSDPNRPNNARIYNLVMPRFPLVGIVSLV